MLTPMGDRAVLGFERVVVTAPGGVEILHGIDLDVAEGRLTVLAGPSGSGKSTLLRLANRLEAPSSGVVRFRGEDVASLDPLALRRRVGMVFQRPTPFAGTVRDNLLVAAPDAGDPAFVAVLERVGLDPSFLGRLADDLSGGESQRMCLARTLLTGPEVVLMDEVTSALDPTARRGVEGLARSLVSGGLTVVWVTHDLVQASRIADAVVVLDEGRLAGEEQRRRFLTSHRGDDDRPAAEAGP